MASESTKASGAISTFSTVVVILTGLLYVVSCFLPATTIGSFGDGKLDIGLIHLVFGYLSGLRGIPAWSANFIIWLAAGCFLDSKYRAASVLGVMAALLGLTTLTSFKLEAMYVGYYLWQSSLIIFAVGAIVARYWSRWARIGFGPSTVSEPPHR